MKAATDTIFWNRLWKPLFLQYWHKAFVSNPLEMVENWFCSHLFFGLLKFQEDIGMVASGVLQGFNPYF